jgi:hypothetical protein
VEDVSDEACDADGIYVMLQNLGWVVLELLWNFIALLLFLE